MSVELFGSVIELSPELIEQHVRKAHRLRSEAFADAIRSVAKRVWHWLRPSHGRLAASMR